MLLFIYDKSNHAYTYDSIKVTLYQMMKNNTTGFFLAFCFELLVIQIIPEIKSIDEMSGMYFVVLLLWKLFFKFFLTISTTKYNDDVSDIIAPS